MDADDVGTPSSRRELPPRRAKTTGLETRRRASEDNAALDDELGLLRSPPRSVPAQRQKRELVSNNAQEPAKKRSKGEAVPPCSKGMNASPPSMGPSSSGNPAPPAPGKEPSMKVGLTVPPPGRYLLALVDPLLEQPIYWRLNKAQITVGPVKAQGCDIVIPWHEMRIRLPPILVAGHPDLPREAPLSSAVVIPDPHRHQAFCMGLSRYQARSHRIAGSFLLAFKDDGWDIHLRGYHARVNFLSKPDSTQLDYSRRLEKFRFTHGGAFKFMFGCGCDRSSECWQQDVRFILVDRESPSEEDDEEWSFRSSPLLSLPPRVLDKIASCMSGTELLDTLLMTNSAVAERLRGHVQWEVLRLDPSLHGLRKLQLASPTAVELLKLPLKCGHLSRDTSERVCPRARDFVYPFWKRLLAAAGNLKRLEVYDVSILRDVQVPSTLTCLDIQYTTWWYGHNRAPLEDLNNVRLPRGIRKLSVLENRTIGAFNISLLFPNLVSLCLSPCPHRAFWTDVSPSFLARIEHFEVKKAPKSHVPLSRMRNLKTFTYSGVPNHLLGCFRDTALPGLSGAAIFGSGDGLVHAKVFSALVASAPGLKYLVCDCCELGNGIDWSFVAKLDYFRASVRRPMRLTEVSRLFRSVTKLKGFHLTVNLETDHDREVFLEMVNRLKVEAGKVGGFVKSTECASRPIRRNFKISFWRGSRTEEELYREYPELVYRR